MLVAWAASVLAGAGFYHLIEAPLARLIAPARLAAMAGAGTKTLPLN
jgi:peptidoglycan/LPS O-acetylase OafA/YrhL